MATYKYTYILNAQKAGWSESWYNENESVDRALATAVKFGLKRMQLLGLGSKIEAVRVSDISIAGDAHVHNYTLEEQLANQVNYEGPTDTPWNAILCRVEAGQNYRRPFHLRGVPDNVIHFNQVNQTWIMGNPTFAEKFEAFIAYAKVNPGIAIKALSKEPAVAPTLKIMQVERISATEVQIFTTANHGFLDNEYVRFRFLKYAGQTFSGRYRVTTAAGFLNRFTIKSVVLDAGVLMPEKATVRKEVDYYPRVTSITIQRATKKATGRAFFSPVGRRSARK